MLPDLDARWGNFDGIIIIQKTISKLGSSAREFGRIAIIKLAITIVKVEIFKKVASIFL